ncbi:SCO2322 family protein [Streptomyces rochei]|uniref:SCO2322 family protein n=1 Tax=Streptomyces TaxID=1883 RepID=UPI001AD8191F|nr:SCO2322 family protein [Streptomyces rochei]WDI18155.1 SCO2322 family protein [Streptomyces enissocaesilis]WMI59511.1 SCO2322 family protein [Streptomyces rochei]
MTRRVVLLLLAAFMLIGTAGQAQAAGYRYWSFWDRDGDTWVYATQGPSLARPSDGDVQGFRFAVSADSQDAARPRGTADFASICAKTPAKEGTKRVALVLDFGTASDAPSGETPPAARTACAQVSPDATTADALAAVADPLRYDNSALLCAIAGYPKSGCGEQVAEQDPTATPTQRPAAGDANDDDGPSVGLYAGIAVVAALAGAATWQARRRRNATD